MAAPRDITQKVECQKYYWENPDTQQFKADEDWLYQDKLTLKKDPVTGDFKSEIYNVHVYQGVSDWFTQRDIWYWYKVDAGFSAKSGGEFYARVALDSAKGLGQQFLVGWYANDGTALDITWVMPSEYCTSKQNFDADKVAEIRFFTRRWYRH